MKLLRLFLASGTTPSDLPALMALIWIGKLTQMPRGYSVVDGAISLHRKGPMAGRGSPLIL